MRHADEFFSDLKEWSGRKLNIIEKYVNVFSRILGSKFNNIFYVDGFAGQGVYNDGEKGSPVLIAELSENLRKSSVAYTLNSINVEKDPEIFSNLRTETARFESFVQNIEGLFSEAIDMILNQIKGNPAIFFIDPFGVKGTDWRSVDKVLSRKDSTDVWIRFDHKTVLRLCGSYDSTAKAARGKLATLQNLFGISDPDYLMKRLGCGKTSEERMDNAVSLYIEQLEKTISKYGKEGFAAAYPIFSIDGQKKYHLVFACGHPKAAILASDIVNGVEETFLREKEEYKENQSGQMNLFSAEITAEQIFDNKIRMLKDSILELPKNKPKNRVLLHYELLVREKKWFGKIRGTH